MTRENNERHLIIVQDTNVIRQLDIFWCNLSETRNQTVTNENQQKTKPKTNKKQKPT